MRRALILSLTLLLGLAACGDGGGGTEPTPSPTTASPSPTESETEATQESTAWFVRAADGWMWVEPETHLVPQTEGVARAAMEVLFAGETDDPNLDSMVEGVEVLGADIDGDVLTVDVSGDIDPDGAGRGSAEEIAFAQQLAYTAAQFDGVRAVRLLVDGEEITDLWGHLDWSQPIEPDPFAETPITIDEPGWGAEVPQRALTASGEANTFEATLAVRLIDPDGAVAEEEWITATSGSGTRGTWEHTFSSELDRPGTWAVEAEEPDPSGGEEGRPPLVVRSEFTVT
ncbi:MAG TPA: Gmad2 immunoglobulin-like domain-containing protein [Egibacteraceae bacterium]|nr:Gmad2 immunoglobulin-like domain-containing protein [Egibacteraceae bacterium]